jgi:Rrf2 family protein
VLTKKAKYALNALVFIAENQLNGLVTSERIAQHTQLSRKFLETILNDLKKQGILSSIKGKQGGYQLQKPPQDIHLVEIIRLFDGAIGLIPCATHQFFQPCKECKDVETCRIRFTFKELRDLNVEFLKNKTLKHLIQPLKL